MKVVTTVTERETKLELGDVVQYGEQGSFYLVMEEGQEYAIKSFRGEGGLIGRHRTMDELNKRFKNVTTTCKVFKRSEYVLHIIKA